jgi:Resolvase, N terminal domain
MSTDRYQKVTADHIRRDAFLYVRQSSLRQVFENTESTKRQYALRDRAVALGWPIERIHIIDSDLGLSGASAQQRDGFQQLVSEVAIGHAGIVLGLEVSRLARNNADWHRLIELAALTHTLILDEDGVYDPAYCNDRRGGRKAPSATVTINRLIDPFDPFLAVEIHVAFARSSLIQISPQETGGSGMRRSISFIPSGAIRLCRFYQNQEGVEHVEGR